MHLQICTIAGSTDYQATVHSGLMSKTCQRWPLASETPAYSSEINIWMRVRTQASRVRFVFGPEALKVVIGEEEEEFENAFVGGANEWKYDTFTNWEFWCVFVSTLCLFSGKSEVCIWWRECVKMPVSAPVLDPRYMQCPRGALLDIAC